MKTAVSIPDEIFETAERLARRLRKSRSQLYAQALSEYVWRHSSDETTEAMNAVLMDVGHATDPFVTSAARKILERAEW